MHVCSGSLSHDLSYSLHTAVAMEQNLANKAKPSYALKRSAKTELIDWLGLCVCICAFIYVHACKTLDYTKSMREKV